MELRGSPAESTTRRGVLARSSCKLAVYERKDLSRLAVLCCQLSFKISPGLADIRVSLAAFCRGLLRVDAGLQPCQPLKSSFMS